MPEPLKYLLYSDAFFEWLRTSFSKHYPSFDGEYFMTLVFDEEWDDRELKARMRHITHCLKKILPLSYPECLDLFKKIISEGKGEGFGKMIFPDFVEVYGQEQPEKSLDALGYYTQFASAEFAIRPFILKYEEMAMDRMLQWAKSDNEHVRRLASEGCRPRLPWAMALPAFKKDPASVLPILEQLKQDPSEYVRRSVANNLNDISKDNPDVVLKIVERWQQYEGTERTVKHACRTLLKKGNTTALLLFGFTDPSNISIKNIVLKNTSVKIGEQLDFEFKLENNGAGKSLLRLEYGINYVKKNGKHSEKIFQISEKQYPPGKTTIKRKQSFKDMSTRKHNPGKHQIGIIVNGKRMVEMEFEVV